MYPTIKRIIDIVVSSVTLVVLFIPFVIISIIIRLETKGPAIFSQQRMGRNLVPFVCYKFRTMSMDAPRACKAENLKNRHVFVTRVGNILRKTSIDELPQLFNVLKGDMSLIGPRPVILAEDNIIRQRHDRGIYTLRPGLSGLAQINGRNFVTDEEKVAYDYEYLRSISFWTDAKLFIRLCHNKWLIFDEK